MKKFLILESNNICYESYIYFAERVAAELNNLGYDTEIFHGTKETVNDLEKYFGKPFTACLEFNSYLPKAILEDNTYLLDHIPAPFYDIILDHPLYHHDILKQKLKNFHVICLDENHKKYIEKYYPHIQSVQVLPMTGDTYVRSTALKTIDLLFTGTYTPPKDIQDIIDMEPSILKKDITHLIEHMLSYTEMTQEEALQLVMKDSGIITPDNFPVFMQHYFLASTYVCAFIREKVINILLDANIPITICGNGWNKFKHKKSDLLTLKPSVPYQDTFALMSQAKIALNIMPWFKAGAHDRIFSAMLNKCVSLTDSSTYLKRIFTSGENIIFYDLKHLDELPQQVTELLHNSDQMNFISENGYTEAKLHHTWKNRVEQMLGEML